jgi:multisubunit Na+/H+ antiporter MnhF subunit
MNEWLLAALILMGALAPLAYVALREGIYEAVVALELGGVIAALVLLALSEGFQRQPFADLALVLAVLSFVGALAFLRFIERES